MLECMDKNKKILIFGSSGMLGYAISKYFTRKKYHVITFQRDKFDIHLDSIDFLIPSIKECDIVINCAGVIKPRIEDLSIEEVLQVNSIFPRNISLLCSEHKKLFFHITTDCVYSGKKGSYDEFDIFDAEDVYGMSKNAGEIFNGMTLRTSIIGPEINQKRSLLSWIKDQKGKEVNGFDNHLWNGVTTFYLAEIIEKIIDEGYYANGIHHIFSKDCVTKYQLLCMINDIYDLNIKINRTMASQEINRTLSTKKELSFKVAEKSLEQQIIEMKSFQ